MKPTIITKPGNPSKFRVSQQNDTNILIEEINNPNNKITITNEMFGIFVSGLYDIYKNQSKN